MPTNDPFQPPVMVTVVQGRKSHELRRDGLLCGLPVIPRHGGLGQMTFDTEPTCGWCRLIREYECESR